MTISIAIIGAGWYGCHIGRSLAGIGFDVTVFEQSSRPLDASSGNNQFRLHRGFHYPRHYETRMQSRDGYLRFIERYPDLSRQIPYNIYAVPKFDSGIDYTTYKMVMSASGLNFIETSPHEHGLLEIEGAILTDERVLNICRARSYFREVLGRRLVLSTRVSSIVEKTDSVYVDGQRFDYVIDATWGRFLQLQQQVYYEPTVLLYYEACIDFPALTFVDGPLCSVYPTEDMKIFTLSSVKYTPLGKFPTPQEAHQCLLHLTASQIQEQRSLMETQIIKYAPSFAANFRYLGPQLAIKTKPIAQSDDRSCSVLRRNRIIGVMSGKIDNIFYATERILTMLETDSSPYDISALGTLRQDVASFSYNNLHCVTNAYR